jgi:mono/diheme cytochrome c family protein
MNLTKRVRHHRVLVEDDHDLRANLSGGSDGGIFVVQRNSGDGQLAQSPISASASLLSHFTRAPAAGLVLALFVQTGSSACWAETSGEADFRASCSACHGEDGRGQGTKDFGLSVAPPDLTTLARRNDGAFPRDRLRRIIDGREDIKIHSNREMPVWGELFKRDAEEGLGGGEGEDTLVARRIEALIDFIESFQR